MSSTKDFSIKTNPWPLATVLTVIFVLLRLFNVIDWNWFWVFTPLWLTAVLLFGAVLAGWAITMLIATALAGLMAAAKSMSKK